MGRLVLEQGLQLNILSTNLLMYWIIKEHYERLFLNRIVFILHKIIYVKRTNINKLLIVYTCGIHTVIVLAIYIYFISTLLLIVSETYI